MAYVLRGTFGGRLYVLAMTHLANEWEDAARLWLRRAVAIGGQIEKLAQGIAKADVSPVEDKLHPDGE